MTRPAPGPSPGAPEVDLRIGPHAVRAHWSDRTEGDFGADDRLAGLGVAWVAQVHGADVAMVAGPGPAGSADAIVAVARCGEVGAPVVAVRTADCGAVALLGDDGSYGALHAGWRGLRAGVVAAAAALLRARGAERIVAALGPVIGPECYEFGEADLDGLVGALGPEVAARTSRGAPALDLRAGIGIACRAAGVELVAVSEVCTACSPSHYSHRARGERERMAMFCGDEAALERVVAQRGSGR